MDNVTEALATIDRLSPEEWKQYSFDEQKKVAAELTGLLHLIDAAILECDRTIREHEWSEGYRLYVRRKEDKVMLKERASRIQRELTGIQTLLKTP